MLYLKTYNSYNELFSIFKKKKDIDINALPDKDILSDILESELPNDIEFEISLVYFMHDRKGDPKRINGDIILTTVEFANRDYHLPPRRTSPIKIFGPTSPIRKGYKVDLYEHWQGLRTLTDVSINDTNIDKFKAYDIKCVQCKNTSFLCYT